MNRKTPDRVPWALWGHFPACRWLNGYSWEKTTRDGEELARAHIAILEKMDNSMDLLKVTPFYQFMAMKWGSKFEFIDNNEQARTKEVAVKNTADWEKLEFLDPQKELREYIRCNEILERDLHTTPYIFTIPSPIIQAMNGISTPSQVLKDIKNNPEALKKGLETITETTIEFAKACVEAGASGIFLGIGGGGRIWRDLNKTQLEQYALGYDKKILDSVNAPIKLLHICSTSTKLTFIPDSLKWGPIANGNPQKLMEEGWFKKYPVSSINWASHQWTPIKKGKEIYGDKFCICGGLDHNKLLRSGTPEQVETAVKKAIDECAEGGGFMIGPGCTVFQDMPLDNYKAVGRAVQKFGINKS
jgi:uroporphyrinogen decarboxylase